MVLPGRHRVGTYARVGAGKINGQDFAVARRRAYRVCRSVWARHNLVPRVRSGRRGQRGSGTRRGKRRQGVASDVDRRRFLMETATRIGRCISGPSCWRRCIRGWLQPRTAGRVGIVRAAILLHLYIRQLWLTFLHSNDSVALRANNRGPAHFYRRICTPSFYWGKRPRKLEFVKHATIEQFSRCAGNNVRKI